MTTKRRGEKEIAQASDVYEIWKREVRSAVESIVIFTPYFDRLLPKLLSLNKSQSVVTKVVTDLSPEVESANYIIKLRVAKKLLNLGIEIRDLRRLHAKVMLIDDYHVILGSQNFTTFGRSSKEASAFLGDEVPMSHFIEKLQEWERNSLAVDEDLIEHLLQTVAGEAKALDAASKSLHDAIEVSMQKFDENRSALSLMRKAQEDIDRNQRFSIDRLLHLVPHQRARVASGTSKITKAWVRSSSGSYYMTMKTSPESSLTSWLVTENQSTRHVGLEPTNWYPILMAKTGRMAWVRVARTRITYAKFGVRDIATMQTKSGQYVKVSLQFPDADTTEANIVFKFRGFHNSQSECSVACIFDGEKFVLIDGNNTEVAKVNSDFGLECRHLLTDPLTQVQVISSCLTSIKFDRIELEEHNASDFFIDSAYFLHLQVMGESPLLIANTIY